MYNNNTVFGHHASSNTQLETLYSGPTSQNFYRDFVGNPALNGSNPLFRKGPDLKITRNSVGSYYDNLGIIRYVNENTPRFNHGPDSVYRGLLIEEERTNYVGYSQDFSVGINQPNGWRGYSVSLLPNSGFSPDSNITATFLEGLPAPGFRGIYFQLNFSQTKLYSRSIFIKRGTNRYLAFCISNPSVLFGPQVVRILDLDTYEWTPFGSGGLLGDADPFLNSKELPIEFLPDDWIRVSNINEPSNENTNVLYIGTASSANWESMQYPDGNNVGGFFIWGAQFEEGEYTSTYIPTEASIIRTRAADNIVSLPLSGVFNHKESSFYVKGSRIDTTLQGSFGGFSQGASQYWELAGTEPSLGETGQGLTLKNGLNTTTIVLSSPLNLSDTNYTLIGSISSNLINLTYMYYAQDSTFVDEITSSVFPPLLATRLRLGQTFNDNFLNGHIQEFGYWPTFLPLSALSSLI